MPDLNEITIAQAVQPISKRRWKWSVWLDADDAVLDNVRLVTYLLHPTFKNPVREVDDRSSAFRLSSEGWGEFNIDLRIEFKDGTERRLSHRLRLNSESSQSATAPQVFISHSHAEREFVGELITLLRDSGVVAADFVDVRPTASIAESIRTQLERADIVVVVSDKALSPNVMYELGYASALGRPIVVVADNLDSFFDLMTTAATFVGHDVSRAGSTIVSLLNKGNSIEPKGP